MHWQKSGLDIKTSAAATWQQWFGAGLILMEFPLISTSQS